MATLTVTEYMHQVRMIVLAIMKERKHPDAYAKTADHVGTYVLSYLSEWEAGKKPAEAVAILLQGE